MRGNRSEKADSVNIGCKRIASLSADKIELKQNAENQPIPPPANLGKNEKQEISWFHHWENTNKH